MNTIKIMNTMSKKAKKEYETRMVFLNTYTEFNQWLAKLGFVKAAYDVSSTYADYHWSHYDTLIDSLYGVEHYQHHNLKIGLRFLRDKNEHKFIFVGGQNNLNGQHSAVKTLDEAKQAIFDMVIANRDKILLDLKPLMDLTL